MLTVISPAKKLDMDRSVPTPRPSQPRLLDEAATLVGRMRTQSPARLAKLMHISADLAKLNAGRFRAWSTPFTTKNATRALLAFDGDVYANMSRDDYDRDDYGFAQKHLRILSGLYGLLRPLDLIQAYRLEMGTALKIGRAKTLAEHWRPTVTALLARDLGRSGSRALVNLASDEYFAAVGAEHLDATVVKPVFKEKRNGGYKVFSFNAKRARGAMVDFIIRERVTEPGGLRDFRWDGYRFAPKLSADDTWVFARG